MRKILLASAALLGAGSGAALAQYAPVTPPTPGTTYNPAQGQYAAPWFGAPSAQNYNNAWGSIYQGPKVPVLGATPSPGTVVIRLNGKVYAEVDGSWGTVMHTAPGTFGTAGYKLNPIGMDSFFRLYPGIDGMATNGLRYGAAIELRENFYGGDSFGTPAAVPATTLGAAANGTAGFSSTAAVGTNASASGESSSQTVMVRRAFVYIGSDQMGIFRLGQGDGLPGIYDALGLFTVGIWDGGVGNLNNGAIEAVAPSQYLTSWPFLSGNGTEYGNNKIVYLSPSFYGVDVGFEFGPNQGNSFSNSSTSNPLDVGPCNTASANCINVTSGTDSSRWINRWGFGLRFIENVGGAVLQGYGDYTLSGEAKNGAAVLAGPTHLATGAGALKYDGQSFFNGGLAATYMGFTINADVTHGRLNGSNALDPTGGVPMQAELGAISYAVGPFSVGVLGAVEDSQGTAQLVGISQRHEVALAVGGAYKIAPGINLCLEYQYVQKHQGDVNLSSGNIGPATAATIGASGSAGNDIHLNGLTFATIVNW